MNSPWKVVAVGVFSFILSACGSKILERKDVGDFNIDAEGDKLKISGLVLHSALGAKEFKSEIKEDAIYIKIELGVANEHIPGRFVHDFTIKLNVKNAYFGNSNIKIWQRE